MKTKRAADQNVPSTTGVRTSTMSGRVNKRGQTAPGQAGQGTSSSNSSQSQSRVSTRQSARRTAAAAAAATATQGWKKL